MKVGIILLSRNNYYVDTFGNLPCRPNFDKELLLALCKGQRAVVGPNTRKALPNSISNIIKEVPWEDDYDINLGIVPLQVNPPHLLIVVRSDAFLLGGKRFDLLDYEGYFISQDLELWIKKSI